MQRTLRQRMLFAGAALAAVVGTMFVLLIVTLTATTEPSEPYAILLAGVGLGGSLLLIGLYAVYVSQRIVTPVNRIAAAMKTFATGNLAARVDVVADDEIGELARNFNAMAEAIHTERAALDATVDGIVVTDLGGNIQIANRPMLRLAAELGFHGGPNVLEQLLSVSDRVLEPERYTETMERLRAYPEQASADEFELYGGRSFVGYTAPVRGEAGPIGRIWTLRDVTQERELDRLKDEFVATVSHELRTPLTSLMGYLEMVRDGEAGELTPEQERFLAVVHRSSERLQRLVGDLLFVARLDASGLQLQLEDGVPLADVVADAVEAASANARSREVALELRRDAEVVVSGDRERLGQLVGNLLSNAIKFTPAGGSVTARVFGDPESGVIEIEDTGIGIPRAEHDRLFERFFRSSTATSQAIPGTGLGLAITRAIAEAHGGQITFTSEPGSGTCFVVRLPLQQSGAGPQSGSGVLG